MNVDFIKWMCEKADGFERRAMHEGDDHYMFSIDAYHVFKTGDMLKGVFYPLLLQRAIEGVNNTMSFRNGDDDWTGIYVEQGCNQILVHSREDNAYKLFENMQIDEAKQSALQYIYEQESK